MVLPFMAALMGVIHVFTTLSWMYIIFSWLKVSPTNHDPKVVCRYFLECIEEVGGKYNLKFKDYMYYICIM